MSDKRDILRDASNDWQLNASGGLAMSTDLAAIAQHLAFRLRQRRGSWFLDLTAGWWDFALFGKSPKLAVIRSLIRQTILETPGVTAIDTLDLDFNKVDRALNVTFSAATDLGLLTPVQTVTL